MIRHFRILTDLH